MRRHVLRVLLVEDYEPHRRLLARLLREEYGYVVTEARDADAAGYELHRGEYDVLITDVRLPRMNGCELAQNVQRAVPTMRVLLLSGSAAAELAIDFPECEGLPLLQKPFTLAEFEHALQRLGVA